MSKSPCMEPGCNRPKRQGVHRCGWHWLARQPIGKQVSNAEKRLQIAQERPGYEFRARVPASEWPAGERWCAGCQWFIPLDYCRGSRCRACASKANHASHVKRTYDITPEEYDALLKWQDGRCYVCHQEPKSLRLAVDHDHETGEVRGLLCANDEWGCNVSLRRLLGDLEAAQRLVSYVEKAPLLRLRDGEPGIGRRVPGVFASVLGTRG